MDKVSLRKIVETELSRIEDSRLLGTIHQFLQDDIVTRKFDWDYGEEGEQYNCWLVCVDTDSNTTIVYCEEGFVDPWGLLFLEGPMSTMGPDGNWFATLEDAVRNAPFRDFDNPLGYEVQ